MATIKFTKRRNWLIVLFFQLCVISNIVFGNDEKLYVVSKGMMLAFFLVVVLQILRRGKIRYNHILLLPILFTTYCGATVLWAYSSSVAMTQMVTQVQLFLLLIMTYWAMGDGVTVLDYLKAIYIGGLCLIPFTLMRYGGLNAYVDAMMSGERMGQELTNLNTFGMSFGNAALAAAYYMILRKKKIHLLSFAALAFFALSSASRKSMLMLVVGVILIMTLHYGVRRLYKTLLITAAVITLTIMVLRLPLFSAVYTRIERLFMGGQDASDISRQRMIQFGLQLFRERPIHGYGMDNFSALYYVEAYSHNNYIELMVNGGIIGLVGYYIMILLPVLGLLVGKKKIDKLDPMQMMLMVWVIVEIGFGFAMVQVYNKTSWMLIGVLMAESVRTSQNRRHPQENQNELVEKTETGNP